MNIQQLKSERVMHYFFEIASIPHGSENCSQITDYCIKFAKKFSLKYYTDNAGNVVIYKDATNGYEGAPTVILQGHLDMVCQKSDDKNIDFHTTGVEVCVADDYLYANGTTLGGDNGIAVAMILSILEDENIKHPAIEAVFTTDEEIGMIGAGRLDMSVLNGKLMINIDSEEERTVTVSCAGGSEVSATLPLYLNKKSGYAVAIHLQGLQGGHSGVEINSGRVNSNVLAGRYLNYLNDILPFDIISINGGDKGNAITNSTKIEILTENLDEFCEILNEYNKIVCAEICVKEPNFSPIISWDDKVMEYSVIIYLLNCIPNGIQQMSAEVDGLVETSLNLGIVSTCMDSVSILSTLRSNKVSSLSALEEKVKLFLSKICCNVKTSGFYPPWEYKSDSILRNKYIETFEKMYGFKPKIEAIHAGLECGVFASKIQDLDCIAIGQDLFDVHTVNEKLSISSTQRVYNVLLKLLENLK